MAEIRLEEITKLFPGGNRAIDQVSLCIVPGERLVIVGPSGSGKTTLLRLIAGLDLPTAGRVLLAGQDAAARPPHQRQVALLAQGAVLWPQLSVRGNLLLAARERRGLVGWRFLLRRGFARKQLSDPLRRLQARVEQVAAQLKIAELLDRRPAELSTGQQQRVALARALINDVAILLCDEPLANLEAPQRAELRRLFRDLAGAAAPTIVWVTHDQAEALAVGDRIAFLDHGRLIGLASPRALLDPPTNPWLARFWGDPPWNLIPGTLEAEALDWRFCPDTGPMAFTISNADAAGLGPGRIASGQKGLLGISPRSIEIPAKADLATPSTYWKLPGQLIAEERRFSGALVELKTPIGLLRALLSDAASLSESPLATPERLVVIDPGKLRWFDASMSPG